MASIITSLALAGSRKADGTVNAGGRVFLTAPGSATVAVTAWTNRDETASHVLDGGGVLLDAAGKAAIFISEPCDIRIEDSTGATVSQDTEPSVNAGVVEVVNAGFTGIDPVSGALAAGGRTYLDTVLSSLAASLGGQDGKYRGVYGTVDRPLNESLEELGLTPQQFGALGDGVTDDTNAFLLLAAAQSASSLPVFIPKGIYQLSAGVVFGANAIIYGAGTGTHLRGTQGTMSCLTVGSFSVVENLKITHASTSTGAALVVGDVAVVRGVFTQAGDYADGFTHSGAIGAHAYDSQAVGSTNGTVGTWTLDLVTVSGTASAGTTYTARSASAASFLYATSTTDMANGGNTTPTIGGTGQPIAYHRIRGTSAGGGTINASASPVGTKILILDCFNNSGGAYTFTLNALYHNTGNPAPANGTRRAVVFVWEPTGAFWVEVARSAADVT